MIRLFVNTAEFDSMWKSSGLEDEELRTLENELIENPSKGAVIAGACSLRKMRFQIPGKGKSGGIRIFYVDFPKFSELHLLFLIRKSEKENISSGDKKQICKLIRQIEKNLEKKYEKSNRS